MLKPDALQSSKLAEIDAIYRTAPIGLCVLDRALRYVRINDRLAEMNGIRASKHIGRTVREMVPALADQLEPLFRRVLGRGRPILGLELHGQTSAQPGVPRVWMENYTPLRDESGKVLGVNISVEEITELRLLQEERARQADLRAQAWRLQEVREEERTRVARELHDELGQELTAVKLGLQWVSGQVAAAPPPVLERLDDLEAALDNTMKAVRRISMELRPPPFDPAGLATSIREKAHQFSATAGICCTVSVPRAEPALSAETATAVFRILQEALTNVRRHARATRVEISLRRKGRSVVLEVRDNGSGIPRAALADAKALGLLGMRERALGVGGTVTISGQEAGGTTIVVMVPAGPWRPVAARATP